MTLRRLAPTLLLLCSLSVTAAGADPGPQEQLLGGVRLFREARYEEALRLFQELSPRVPEIGFYLGTTLHKLGRHAEALAAFRQARSAGLREPVAAYYEAVSCYRLGLLGRAQAGFQALLSPGAVAPRLHAGVGRFLQAIDAATAMLPMEERAAAALARAEALSARRSPEAEEWIEEARLLIDKAPAIKGRQDLLRRVQQLAARPAGGS